MFVKLALSREVMNDGGFGRVTATMALIGVTPDGRVVESKPGYLRHRTGCADYYKGEALGIPSESPKFGRSFHDWGTYWETILPDTEKVLGWTGEVITRDEAVAEFLQEEYGFEIYREPDTGRLFLTNPSKR